MQIYRTDPILSQGWKPQAQARVLWRVQFGLGRQPEVTDRVVAASTLRRQAIEGLARRNSDRLVLGE